MTMPAEQDASELSTVERRSGSVKNAGSALNQRDRRDAYRVHIPGALPLQPVTFVSEAGPIKGRLIDISRSGASTLLEAHFEARIGSYLPCNIGLPDGLFHAVVEIRSSKPLKKTLRLGLLFSELTTAEHSHIDHAIARLERSLLRYHNYFSALGNKPR